MFKRSITKILSLELAVNTKIIRPDWCGSVGRVSSFEPADFWSQHTPGFEASFPAGGVQEATNQCFSPSLSSSLPLSLKINA